MTEPSGTLAMKALSAAAALELPVRSMDVGTVTLWLVAGRANGQDRPPVAAGSMDGVAVRSTASDVVGLLTPAATSPTTTMTADVAMSRAALRARQRWRGRGL